jgi:hypothetical protein
MVAAARAAGLAEPGFRRVPDGDTASLVRRIREAFGPGLAHGAGEPLWASLQASALPAPAPHSLAALCGLGPPDIPVLLLVEDWARSERPGLCAFETTLSGAIVALENHHLVEFYIVPPSLAWLVAENHHNVLLAAGDHAVSVLTGVGG